MSDLNTLLAQRASLDQQIAEAQRATRAQNLAKIKALMEQSGISVADLGGAARVGTKVAAKVPAKYRDAAGNTWSGRGFQPVWLREALKAGASLESFRIPDA